MEYDRHENDPVDPGYRRFLSRLFNPVAALLSPGARGIDYGCGPGPALSRMFAEAGFPCANYDPFYAADRAVLERQYDFLVCSETIEHCRDPKDVFERFLELVRPGGVVGIMTQLVIDHAAFVNWRYIADPTHICFFSTETFRWMAKRYGIEAKSCEKSVTLFLL